MGWHRKPVRGFPMPTLITHPTGKITYSNRSKPTHAHRQQTRLIRLITDGDMRRAIITAHPLEAPPRPKIKHPEIDKTSPLYMGLSEEIKFTAPVRTRSKGMGSKARAAIRERLYVAQEVIGKDKLSFVTGTTPNEVAQWVHERVKAGNENPWPHVLDVFLKTYRRAAKKGGFAPLYLWVLEPHPERSAEAGYPILHTHIAWRGRKPFDGWVMTPQAVTNAWKNAWETVLPEHLQNLNWSASTNVQSVRKGLGNYFGKYLSKGADARLLALLANAPDNSFPRNWYGCSRNLIRITAKNTYRHEGEAARSVIDLLCQDFMTLGLTWNPVLLTREDGTCFDIAGAFYGGDPPGIRFWDVEKACD